jgi:hypothetical protein
MALPKPKIENFTRVLVVEGYSDQLFYLAVLKAIGKEGLVFVKEFGGKDNLKEKLDTFITPQLLAEKTHIAVIVDADKSPEGTFTSLSTRLAELTKQQIQPSGMWTNGSPRSGLFVAPDVRTSGEIETLVWRAWSAISSNATAKAHVEDYIAKMKNAGHSAHSPDKGLLGALLAILNDEDPRLGAGAREGVFDFTTPEFRELREFFAAF